MSMASFFLGNNDEMIEEFKSTMTREFEMTDLGLLKFFLGLEVKQRETDIFISQETYAKEILKKYKMKNCNRYQYQWNLVQNSQSTMKENE